MALDVKQRLNSILMTKGQMSFDDAEAAIYQMRRTGRLMEEYFG